MDGIFKLLRVTSTYRLLLCGPWVVVYESVEAPDTAQVRGFDFMVALPVPVLHHDRLVRVPVADVVVGVFFGQDNDGALGRRGAGRGAEWRRRGERGEGKGERGEG